jgi:hypothetical protein
MQSTSTFSEPIHDPPAPDEYLFNVDVIQTAYDRFAPFNTSFPARHDRQENIAWTDSEHAKAELGSSAQSVKDLHQLVGILTTGKLLMSLTANSSCKSFILMDKRHLRMLIFAFPCQ